jgi:hypothetical protein
LKDYSSVVEDKKSSIRRPIKDIYIPAKDENISTREVRKCASGLYGIGGFYIEFYR